MKQVLSRLLEPIEPEQFVAEHWERRSLVVRGGLGKVRDLIGLDLDPTVFADLARRLDAASPRLREYAARFGEDPRSFIRASFPFDPVTRRRPLVHARPDQADELRRAGASLQISALQLLDDEGGTPFRRLSQELQAALRYHGIVQISATYSPPETGFDAHFDPTGTMILQTHGRKRYRVGERPLVPFPQSRAYVTEDKALHFVGGLPESWEQELSGAWPDGLDVVLEPGDVLYFPSGAVHQTHAIDDSIGLLIVFAHERPSAIVSSWIDNVFGGLPSWRHVSVRVEDAPAAVRVSAEQLRERLDDLRAALERIASDDLELAVAAARSLAAGMAPGPEDPAPPAADLERRTTLRLTRDPVPLLVHQTRRDGAEVAILVRGAVEATAEGALAPVLASIATRPRFTGGELADAHGEIAWEDVRDLLEELARAGFLVVES